MCLGASYWARVKAVYYIASKDDAAKAGFDDSFIYRELDLPHSDRSIPFIKMDMIQLQCSFRYLGKPWRKADGCTNLWLMAIGYWLFALLWKLEHIISYRTVLYIDIKPEV
jgi:hypothetical protein